MAVVGPNADVAVMMGGGSAAVEPDQRTSPLEALRAKLGDAVTVVHEPGVDLSRATAVLRIPLTAEYFDGLEGGGETVHRAELHATELMHLGPPVARLGRAFLRPGHRGLPTVGAGPVSLHADPRGSGPAASSMVSSSWTASTSLSPGARASWVSVLEELTGEVDLTGGRDVADRDRVRHRRRPRPVRLQGGLSLAGTGRPSERAVAAAGAAEMAIVVVGTSNEWESEGFDRESLALPADQDDLVQQVAAANPRTVVVVNTGAPVAMPWVDDVGAVLQIWFGGQEMAAALADVLTGDEEPGGRLPVSLPLTPGGHPGLSHLSRRTERAALRGRPSRRLPLVRDEGHRRHLPLRSRTVVYDVSSR